MRLHFVISYMLFVYRFLCFLFLLCYLLACVNHCPAFVGSAIGANTVHLLGCTALLTGAKIFALKGVVRATIGRVRPRMSHPYCHSF